MRISGDGRLVGARDVARPAAILFRIFLEGAKAFVLPNGVADTGFVQFMTVILLVPINVI